MLDSRFPFLSRIADARELDGVEKSRALRIAGSVCGRTGTNCCWDAHRGGLHFYYGDDPSVGVFCFHFKPPGTRRGCYVVSESDIDDMVRLVQMGKVSPRIKDRIAANNAAEDRKDRDESMGRFLEDNRRNALDYAGFLERKRRGVPKAGILV